MDHTDSSSTCVILDEKIDRVFKRRRTAEVLECVHETQRQMNEIPDVSLTDQSCIEHFIVKPEPFLDSMPDDNHAKLKAHAAWYNEEDHETIS